MFWRFNYMPSRVDSLLDKEDVTLQELMDEDDVVQECKSQNRKLVDFLVQPQMMETLVNMVVGTPSDDSDDKTRYKYPNIACDLITSDVNQITEMLATTESLLTTVYAFLESDSDLNPLQASFFSKVMGLLITRKSELMINFLKARDNFVEKLLHHLGVSAIMDLLLRLITCIESTECRNDCINWLNEQRLVARLVAMIDPVETPEKHTNAAQSLCDIIRLSREQLSQVQDLSSNGDALLKSIETSETLSSLLDHMLNGEHTESVIVNGLYVIQTLLECRKISPEGIQEPMSLMSPDQLSPGMINTVNAVVPRLKDFHQILLEPPVQHYTPMPTTVGTITVPLGQSRLHIVRLISMLIMTNMDSVSAELASHGTLSVMLDLFFQYSWNNFLHAHIEQCIAGILTSTLPNNELQAQLFNESRLLERIVEAFEDDKSQNSGPGQKRPGYMGHLTRIANYLVNSTAADSANHMEHISSLFEEVPESIREQWNHCVCGSLADINKLNTVELVGGGTGLTSSSDDDEEFHSISFPQDDAMQKAFIEYQQQKMTSDFVEQFGFNEEEFAEQEECIGSPFNDRISSINFELSTVEDSPTAAAMFEHACSDRIRQFDNADSDEELWEDKELSFSRISENRHSSAVQRSHNTATGAVCSIDSEGEDYEDEALEDSDGSDDSDPELASPRYIRQTNLSDENSTSSDVIIASSTTTDVDSTFPSQQQLTEETSMKTDAVESDAAMDSTSGSDEVHVESVSIEPESMEVNTESVNVDQVTLDIVGSSVDAFTPPSIELVPVEKTQSDGDMVVPKLEPLRPACHLDARGVATSGVPEAVPLSSVHNGPV